MYTSGEWEEYVIKRDRNVDYGTKVINCPQCGRKKRSFWSGELDFPCDDCSILNHLVAEEDKLMKALSGGIIQESDLGELGLRVLKERRGELR